MPFVNRVKQKTHFLPFALFQPERGPGTEDSVLA